MTIQSAFHCKTHSHFLKLWNYKYKQMVTLKKKKHPASNPEAHKHLTNTLAYASVTATGWKFLPSHPILTWKLLYKCGSS